MGLEFSEKLDLLGGGAAEEVSCQTCAANPNASVVTHRATAPLSPHSLLPLGEGKGVRDLKPWLSSAIRSDGKRIPLVKTFVVQSLHSIGIELFRTASPSRNLLVLSV